MSERNVGEKYTYQKKDLLGHGAFAAVFKGKCKEDEKGNVAIKVINRSRIGKQDKLLGKEVQILKKLKHDNIVCLLDYEETKDSIYLVMEYCNSGDLADYLHKQGTLSEDTIRYFLQQIVAAMKVLNEKGIIHRDLKPGNILLNKDGSRLRVKRADFGFARHLEGADMAATLCGSPMYMAPEVLRGHAYDSTADLYSIGTIVYQCLTGRAPFHATSPQELRTFYERTEFLKPNIPAGTSTLLAELICSLLKKNPKERMSAADFFKHPFMKERIRKKHHSSSPTIPDAKVRTPSPIDSRTSSMASVQDEELVSASGLEDEEFVLIPSPVTRQRAKTVSDFTTRDELLRREHRNASLPGRRPHHHRYSPQDLDTSPSTSPVEHMIQRANTQPDLARYALTMGHYSNRQSVPSDLKFRADPRRETPRATLPYPEPQRQLVPRVPPPRTNFTIGISPPDYSPTSLMTLAEEDDLNNNESSSLLEQLEFSYELGLAINDVASSYQANTFRRRGERALLYYKGLEIFVSALHKARNSDISSIQDDKATLRAVLLKIHDKFKECRKLCNEQEDTRQQAEKQKNQKLFSADSILYKFAINLVSDTACADTSGELEKDELKTKYLTARTLLKGLSQTFDDPQDKRKLQIYQKQISSRLEEIKSNPDANDS